MKAWCRGRPSSDRRHYQASLRDDTMVVITMNDDDLLITQTCYEYHLTWPVAVLASQFLVYASVELQTLPPALAEFVAWSVSSHSTAASMEHIFLQL